MMKLFSRLVLVAIAALLVSVPGFAQSPESTPSVEPSKDPNIRGDGVIGEVISNDQGAKQLIVKTDAGNQIKVTVDERTQYLRVAPGEKSLEKAAKVAASDLGLGDRVFARGSVSADISSVTARIVIMMSRADIARKNELERMEWRRRGISGTISAINAVASEITIQARTREGNANVVLPIGPSVKMRRYPPDSVKFADAKESTFADLRVGDQIRALGQRSADGARYTPDELVSGAFRTVVAVVKSVKSGGAELTVEDSETRKPLTLVVKKDSTLRRFPSGAGAMFGQRMGGGPGGPGGRPAPAEGAGAGGPGGRPSGGQTAMQGGQGARPPGGGSFDLSDMIERMPALNVSELKSGELVVFLTSRGSEPGRATAITLVAGIEPLVQMLLPAGARGPGGGRDLGIPSGLFDLGIGVP